MSVDFPTSFRTGAISCSHKRKRRRRHSSGDRFLPVVATDSLSSQLSLSRTHSCATDFSEQMQDDLVKRHFEDMLKSELKISRELWSPEPVLREVMTSSKKRGSTLRAVRSPLSVRCLANPFSPTELSKIRVEYTPSPTESTKLKTPLSCRISDATLTPITDSQMSNLPTVTTLCESAERQSLEMTTTAARNPLWDAWCTLKLKRECTGSSARSLKFSPTHARDSTPLLKTGRVHMRCATIGKVKQSLTAANPISKKSLRKMTRLNEELERVPSMKAILRKSKKQRMSGSAEEIISHRTPKRFLNATGLLNDFYSQAFDYAKGGNYQNLLACGLTDSVELYDDGSEQTQTLCTVATDRRFVNVDLFLRGSDYKKVSVTATAFAPIGNSSQLAVATNGGVVSVWDVSTQKCVSFFKGCAKHIGTLEWANGSAHTLVHASKDASLLSFTDIRSKRSCFKVVDACAKVVTVKWGVLDAHRYAVGQRDNNVRVFDVRKDDSRYGPAFVCRFHQASVRAMAWSPLAANTLCTGGGSNDRRICIWHLAGPRLADASTGTGVFAAKSCVDAFATCLTKPVRYHRGTTQVTNLIWEPNGNRILSTHGQKQNDIRLWDAASLRHVETVGAHRNRVVHCTLASDKQTVATAGADETLRVWTVFDTPAKSRKEVDDMSLKRMSSDECLERMIR